MNRLYSSGLLMLLIGVAVGTVAVVRSATTLDACGLPLVPWLGSGEAPSDPQVVADCPAQKSDRRSEVVVEAGISAVLLLVGIAVAVLGRRQDNRDQWSLPPDPFAPSAQASP